ncbi:MAG TPA: hypothetical protein VM534_09085 [Thermoanaerobaculia bacterium]|nr:hypothetical protein [Thermoanaerobaculia bacterium]
MQKRLLTHAIESGLRFLDRRQLPSGEIPVQRWTAARCDPDPSVFPTALAAWSLSFAPEADVIVQRALDFLEGEMDGHGLWRHWSRDHPLFRFIPPDLDDTAVASAALTRAGRSIPDNRDLLLANRNRRGLFRTWKLTRNELRRPHALCWFFLSTSASPFDVDAVVNANVFWYLGWSEQTAAVPEQIGEILRAGRESGCDKWYEKPVVVRYFFSRALAGTDSELLALIEQRSLAPQPLNALEAALRSCTLLNCDRIPDVGPLLSAQLESGAWPRVGFYHGGRRRRIGGGFAPAHPASPWWGSEELTTLFCIEALARFRSSCPDI